jgi:predicted MFS family arabinose efflux permease
VRSILFCVVAVSYLLSYFHRLAPATIHSQLTESFGIDGAALGSLAATYFYMHMLMQIPAGVLTDTLGARRILVLGAAVTGAGCLLFALTQSWHVAAVGRLFVGLGTSVTFIAFLKLNALWFDARQFATVGGLTIMLGNLGSVFGAAPLAWLITFADWQTVFVGLGVLSLVLVPLTWVTVRDRPQDMGFTLPQAGPAHPPAPHWRTGLWEVLKNRSTWPGFWVNLGICGSFFCFTGLWAVPYLTDTYGYSNVVATNHTTLLLIGVAVGALVIGRLSDRFANRKTVMLAFAGAYLVTWLPLITDSQLPLAATYALFLVMGLVLPSYTLTWAAAKEVNRPAFSGMATGVVNVGCFLGAGIMQPLIGWILDSARAHGDLADGYHYAVLVLFGFSLLGFLAVFFVRETRGENQWTAPETTEEHDAVRLHQLG